MIKAGDGPEVKSNHYTSTNQAKLKRTGQQQEKSEPRPFVT